MSNSIGALWITTAPNGRKYMSGMIKVNGVEQKVSVFKNDRKKETKHPDYNVVERGEGGGRPAKPVTSDSTPEVSKPYTPSTNHPSPPGDNSGEEIKPEDIPF